MPKVLFAVSLLVVLNQVSKVQAEDVNNWDSFVQSVNSGKDTTVVNGLEATSDLSKTFNNDVIISGQSEAKNSINGNNHRLFLRAGNRKTLTVKNLDFKNFNRFNPAQGHSNHHSIFSAMQGTIIFDNVGVENVAGKDDDDKEPIWGAVFNVSDNGSAAIKNSIFNNNSSFTEATGEDNAIGGVINVQGKTVNYEQSNLTELSSSTFENNSIKATKTNAYGGVLYLEGQAGTVENNTFANNTATGNNAYGGAIAIGGANKNRGTALLDKLIGGLFKDNKVVSNAGGETLGGALYVSADGQINTISCVTFSGNKADKGGAIYNAGLIDTITGSKFETASDTIVNVNKINTIADTDITGELSNLSSGTIAAISGGSIGALTNTGAITTISGGTVGILTNNNTIASIQNVSLTGDFQNNGTASVTGSFGSGSAKTVNNGTLNFDNVTYTGVMTNAGTFKLQGSNELNGLFTNNATATVSGAMKVEKTVNNGVMSLTDVDYDGEMQNNTRLNTSGDTTFSGKLENTNQLNIADGSLTLAGGLQNSGTVMSNGVLTMSGNSSNSGLISGDITIGDGTKASVFSNTGYVMGKTNIKNNAVVKSPLEELNDIDIAAGGRLDIDEDSILKHNITGAGETRISNKLYLGQGSLSADGVVTVADSGMIDLGSKNINVGTFNLDGALDVDISAISANVSDYTGGQVIVSNGATIGNDAELTVTIASDMLEKGEKTGELKLIDGNNVNGKFNNIASNNRYKIEAGETDGTIVITGIATAGDVAGMIGNRNNQNTAAGWDTANVAAGSQAAEIKSILNAASQHDAARYVRDLTLIAPTDSKLALMTTREVNNQISRSTWNRFSRNKKSCGEPFAQTSMWMEGLGNYSHQDNQFEAAGFSARTAGYMLGVDGTIDCATTAGVGYAFNYTDASSDGRDTDIKGHTVFTYAKYQPQFAYVRGLLSYGYADYKEKSAVENIALSAKYNVQAVSAEAAAGYEFKDGFIPEAGLRYTYLMPESYTDSLGQKINPDNTNLLTATAMLHFRPRCGDIWYYVRPTAYVGLTYDLYGPNTKTNVRIADSSYLISSKRMPRLGAEGGIGLETSINNWDISIGYDLGLREDYQSHTGMLKARYNF